MEKKLPYITVRIPYEPGKKLGYAIKREMRTVDDWVLILDHDVLVGLNPRWYEMCQYAINLVGHEAGWITCTTNKIGCPLQKIGNKMPKNQNDSMEFHFNHAQEKLTANYLNVFDITDDVKKWKLSGFFILTHKKAFEHVVSEYDLPEEKFIGFDNWYNDRLLDLGYKMYIINGLYVYHGYQRSWKKEFWKNVIIE